jgi:hypothetical protein
MQRNPIVFLKNLGIVLAYSFLHSARADLILHPWENFNLGQATSQLQYKASYFETTTNYLSQGQLISPTGLRQYQRIQNDMIAQWSWNDHSNLFMRAAWAYLNQDSATHPGKRWGLTDQTLGLNTALYTSPGVNLDFQTQLDIPAYARSSSPQAPALGDGSFDLTSGFFLKIPLLSTLSPRFTLLSGLGYTVRSHGFSSSIPITLGVLYHSPQGGLFASLQSFSFFSLKTDAHAKNPALYRSNNPSGGSLTLQAMNPSLSQIQLKAGYEFRSLLQISLSALRSLWGQMAPENHQLSIHVQIPLSPDKPSSLPSSSPVPTPTPPPSEPPPTPPLSLPSTAPVPVETENPQKISSPLSSAVVLKSHDHLNLVKINRGTLNQVQIGQLYELFDPLTDPSLLHPIARARVTHTRPEEAALEITDFITETWIAEGFIARVISH